ncbi:IPT/TIG domain-containing protein [Fulvimonas soli]|uniref:YD repeat-containing protein n=1 Tax=Fulvimonas soli TaxID=155197 RepID=A0A316HNR4_9GAMM|nr:IPT/TIG domain-containing protein [Fulvimonas soli]PWK82356.1 YD repeat-containing protein [Fulvimonas soli]
MQSVYGGRRSGIGKSAMQATPQRLSGLRLAAVQWLALAFGAVLPLLAPAQTNYVYDANGRLVGVTSASGQSVRYVYDDNGNRVRTDTLPATQLALFGFSPEHGAPGSTVLLSGQGFSSTASANAVRFNGVTADVLSATVNALEVTVPANTTSGPISVTAGGVTATSQTPFVVDGTGLPPTLASVSPLLGAAGTVVTLTGEHLDPVPGATTVTLNGVAVVPTTITDTTISFAIPKTFGSGRFQVTTPYGQATAASDFMTIPADYKNNYAITSSRLVVGGVAAPVTAASSSDVKEFVFDAVADTWVTLQAVGIVNTASLQLYDPRGFVLGEQLFISQSRPSAHFLQLPMTGTYTLVVWPMGAAGFNVNLERDGQILLDSPYVFATAQNGESERLMFKADAGESFGIGLINPQTSSAGSTIRTELLDANGQSLSYENCEPGQSTPVCDLNAPGFQVSPYLASLPPAGWRQLVLTSEQ